MQKGKSQNKRNIKKKKKKYTSKMTIKKGKLTGVI